MLPSLFLGGTSWRGEKLAAMPNPNIWVHRWPQSGFLHARSRGSSIDRGAGSGLQIFSASIHSPPLKLRQLVRSTGQRARRYGWTRRLEFMQGHAVHRLRGGSAPGKKPCLFRVLRDMDCRIGQPEESLVLVCRARCRKAACQVVVGRAGIGVRHDQPLPSRSAIHG